MWMVVFLWENVCYEYPLYILYNFQILWNYGQYMMELVLHFIDISVYLQVFVTIQGVSSSEPASTLACGEIYLPCIHILHDTLYTISTSNVPHCQLCEGKSDEI